jgi:hypothetical protein
MELSKESRGKVAASTQLHQFDRSPVAVAEEWRTKLGDGELQRIEDVAGATLAKVEAARLRLLA